MNSQNSTTARYECNCGSFMEFNKTNFGKLRWASVRFGYRNPSEFIADLSDCCGRPAYMEVNGYDEGVTESDTVIETKERTMQGTTATVTIEIDGDGGLTDDERRELAVALLEEGQNTEFASWDDDHMIPTRNGRSI